MTSTANLTILVLSMATATVGYIHDRGRQSTLAIKLPSVTNDRL